MCHCVGSRGGHQHTGSEVGHASQILSLLQNRQRIAQTLCMCFVGLLLHDLPVLGSVDIQKPCVISVANLLGFH